MKRTWHALGTVAATALVVTTGVVAIGVAADAKGADRQPTTTSDGVHAGDKKWPADKRRPTSTPTPPWLVTPTPTATPTSTAPTTTAPTTTAPTTTAPTTTAPTTTAPTTTPPTTTAPAVTGTTYYVDPTTGNDSNSGLSPAAAVRTLTKVGSLPLKPGDAVRLKAGTTQVGGVWAQQAGTAAAPITLDSYGSGPAAVVSDGKCLQLAGDYWTVKNVKTAGCSWAGFQVFGDHVTLDGIEATGSIYGITLESGADYAVIRNSNIHDNTKMAPNTPGPDDDFGANGIAVGGDYALIDHNRISGNVGPSADYGVDGAAIEIYGAIGTRVFRNVAKDNITFTELGNARTSNTRYAYNVVTSSLDTAQFIVTRGALSNWGPVYGTTVDHNTVLMTGRKGIGIACDNGCTPQVLTIRSNVILAEDAGYAGLGSNDVTKGLGAISAGYNLIWSTNTWGYIGFPLASTDVVAKAAFVSPGTGDLRLMPGTPGIDIGGPNDATDVLDRPGLADGDGDGVARADAGAYERPAGGL